jgi:hypothetical protein
VEVVEPAGRGERKMVWWGAEGLYWWGGRARDSGLVSKWGGAAGLCVQGRGGLRPPLVLSGLLKGKGGAVGSVLLFFFLGPLKWAVAWVKEKKGLWFIRFFVV